MATTKVRGELVDLNESTSESGLKMPSGTELNRPTAVAINASEIPGATELRVS